jgi:hypothetical protein
MEHDRGDSFHPSEIGGRCIVFDVLCYVISYFQKRYRNNLDSAERCSWSLASAEFVEQNWFGSIYSKDKD